MYRNGKLDSLWGSVQPKILTLLQNGASDKWYTNMHHPAAEQCSETPSALNINVKETSFKLMLQIGLPLSNLTGKQARLAILVRTGFLVPIPGPLSKHH